MIKCGQNPVQGRSCQHWSTGAATYMYQSLKTATRRLHFTNNYLKLKRGVDRKNACSNCCDIQQADFRHSLHYILITSIHFYLFMLHYTHCFLIICCYPIWQILPVAFLTFPHFFAKKREKKITFHWLNSCDEMNPNSSIHQETKICSKTYF